MSPAVIGQHAQIFMRFMHALLGLYLWEWAISLDFDWLFISGKRKFRWPLIFYFANRYLLLGAMVGIAIALDSYTEIDCQSIYTFNQLSGQAAVGLASINLSLRTIAVWGNNKVVIGGLVLLILGHWSLILQGVLLKAQWDPVQATCMITETNNTILAATFIYSMVFDLIVLLLNVWKLGFARTGAAGVSMKSGSNLAHLIFKDGLIYFFIAFLGNVIATVFMVLNLNPIMSVIFNVPSAIASTIVATRVVRRLTNFGTNGPEVYSNNPGSAMRSHSKVQKTSRVTSGVHVQMDTFTAREDLDQSATFAAPYNDKNRYSPDRDIESKGGII